MAGNKYFNMKITVLVALLACTGVTETAPAPLRSLSRPARAAPLLQQPFFAGLEPPLRWAAARRVAAPRPLVSRRSHVPAIIPRRSVHVQPHEPPAWPSAALVHGKHVHWPALRRDGFMLHHKEVNRGHHHSVHFGSLPAENELMDMMIL